jgi:CheY-like chemotaxis protein/anti-sigma regulatory factor (Ser/Thr protein kinase)
MEQMVLVVDDEEIIRKVVTEGLTLKGYRVCSAENGTQAEKIFLAGTIDLLLSDIMMPECDGYELAKRIKFVNPRAKIILMTGYHTTGNVPFCLKHNIARYIKKPFHLQEVYSAVTEALDEHENDIIRNTEETSGGWLDISFASNEESLLRLYNLLNSYLMDFTSKKIAQQVAQYFYEMCRNAIEWGNEFNKNKLVFCSCMVMQQKVVFKIQDEGEGFNVVEGMNPIKDLFERQRVREKQGKRPGGFGIEITGKYMDELFYNEKGNCLIMSKNLDTRAPDAPYAKEEAV